MTSFYDYDDPDYCPETSDGVHCGHWHDGDQCCACGLYGPEPEDYEGPGEFTPAEEDPW
ncbi:MAG TPA: hypothetical protein VKV35_12790 [Streptosporangiaceae bacterium]|jgi:hypothetical protein|nr:hypothetical protein [Streptosporangiaceae bacterium]